MKYPRINVFHWFIIKLKNNWTMGWTVWKFPGNQMMVTILLSDVCCVYFHTAHTRHVIVLTEDHTLWEIIHWNHWSNTWEVTNATIIRKCKLLSMNGRHYNSLIYTMTAFCNLCHDGTSASICLRSMLTNNHTSEE